MTLQTLNCLILGFYLWILSGSFLWGFQHKRSLDFPSSQLSNNSKSCQNCTAPSFDRGLDNQTVNEGDKVVFKCHVSSNPPSDITWYKNGILIRNRSRPAVSIKRYHWGSRLKIRAVGSSDAGFYSCIARNSLGSAKSLKVFLDVNESKTTFGIRTTITTMPVIKKEPSPIGTKPPNPEGRAALPIYQGSHTTSDLYIPTPPPISDNGTCMPYNGTLCTKFLRAKKPVFVKNYETLEGIETKISNAYSNIRDFKELSQGCRPFVLPLLCHYKFPYCDGTSPIPRPRPICYEECDTLRKEICKKEYRYIIAEGASLEHILFPKCSTLPRRGTPKGKNCITFGVNHVKSGPTIPSNDKVFTAPVCFTGTGEDYRANVSVTEKGFVCQRWNATKPRYHLLSAEDYPEIQGGHNFCRNPGGNKKKPWCFTTGDYTEFDFCDIPRCEEPPPVQVVSVLYTVIPCLLFAIVFSSAVIFICWRCHKQIIYQAGQSVSTPLVPVVGKPTDSKIKELRRETVRFLKDLGEGDFGKLYKGEVLEKVEGKQTTRAILSKLLRNNSSTNSRESFLRQAETWSKFNHPNIISVIGMCLTEPPTCILYECIEYGTLYDYLVENSPLEGPDDEEDPETLSYYDMLSISVQIAAGMNYLSQVNYIHGDLATRNCMVGPRMVVKITDFALSRSPYANDYHRVSNRPPMPVRWMAPEGILNYRFTVETDIWSFGVVLWEIFSFGSRPHCGYSDEEVMDRIREHVLLPCPPDCPVKVFVLMKECWDILPPSRPRFSTIYTHLCALRCDSNGLHEPIETCDIDCFHVDV